MILERISKLDYDQLDGVKIIFSQPTKTFGKLAGAGNNILLAWKSELVEPVLMESNNVLLIGLDNRVAIYNTRDHRLLALYPLSSNFLSFLTHRAGVIIITELEVLVLSEIDFSIGKHIHLPDLVENYKKKGDLVRIICMNGDIIEVS